MRENVWPIQIPPTGAYRPVRNNKKRYKDRWMVEAAFCWLKDFRRIAARYDKLSRNFLSAIAFAMVNAFWV
ncbi:MAG: hypothetical protein COA52_11650 [Hyphomicrobiales bacterium]|nr:transposase [Hyphomicrobiales bacterium]PCJ89739.1 MAG: hypothetical protein COA52_11650 [Hyphomicrobiales bacterium]